MSNYDDTPGQEIEIQAFSLKELLDDPKSISDDLIHPKILLPSDLFIFCGAPKVGTTNHANLSSIYISGHGGGN